jgi:hypothetical protein
MLENPIILAALNCFFLGLALSGLARVVPGSTIASVVLPIIFLASYIQTYQQVPDFPPIGATNKIFYIALAAALVGFALDLLPRLANYRKLLAVIMPLLIVAWIGFPRFAKPDIELIATALGLWLGGAALLWRLEIVAPTPAECNGGSIVGTAMLMALMLAFAPIAHLGGSSTSLMLCLAAVAGLAAVWPLRTGRQPGGSDRVPAIVEPAAIGENKLTARCVRRLLRDGLGSPTRSLSARISWVDAVSAWLLI